MRIFTPDLTTVIIRDYALNRIPNGIQEKNIGIPQIYPDPASDKVMVVNASGTPVPESLVISDITGKRVVAKTFPDFSGGKCTIDVSGFRDGVYIVSLFQAKSVIHRKFIVKH
jgi:hypothetical protein